MLFQCYSNVTAAYTNAMVPDIIAYELSHSGSFIPQMQQYNQSGGI